MEDIVNKLRDRAYSFKATDSLLQEAADEIARLRDLRDNWHHIRRKLEEQIKFLESQLDLRRNGC